MLQELFDAIAEHHLGQFHWPTPPQRGLKSCRHAITLPGHDWIWKATGVLGEVRRVAWGKLIQNGDSFVVNHHEIVMK